MLSNCDRSFESEESTKSLHSGHSISQHVRNRTAGNVRASLDQRRVLNRMCVCHDLRKPKTSSDNTYAHVCMWTYSWMNILPETCLDAYVRLLHMCAGEGTADAQTSMCLCICTHIYIGMCAGTYLFVYVRTYVCLYACMHEYPHADSASSR